MTCSVCGTDVRVVTQSVWLAADPSKPEAGSVEQQNVLENHGTATTPHCSGSLTVVA